MIDIRLPNITGKTEAEQLAQMKSYLYQFAGQLQWALSTVEASNGTNVVVQKNGSGSSSSSGSVTDPTTFNELKALIIKSADIVEAYYEKIDNLLKLSGDYTAYSEYGIFKEETQNALSANNAQIQQNIESLQSIFDADGNIKAELLVNGHIYSGIIEYAKTGEAIVGIEIGQTTTENGEKVFDKFARFTADRLSFYDTNGIEVAYISDYKLYITNAWIIGDLELGKDNSHFKFDTSNGIALIPVKEV